MKRSLPFLAFAAIAAVLTIAPARAAAVMELIPGGDVMFATSDGIAYAMSWTFTADQADVDISGFFGGSGDGRAYLMRNVGTGTTIASEIASFDFTPSNPNGGSVSLFNNLALVAGTYFLVIEGRSASELEWYVADDANFEGDIEFNAAYVAVRDPSYAPGSMFSSDDVGYAMTVTGNAVPEPASASLALAGAALLVMRRRR